MNLEKIEDNNPAVFKRKFRWTLSGDFLDGKIREHFIKVSSRPTFKIEEIKVPKSNTWIPCKSEWDVTTTTHHEVDTETSADLYKVLGSFWGFWDNVKDAKGYDPADEDETDKYGSIYLKLYDGYGTILEEWNLLQTYPKNINFVDLDLYSSETILEITWAYKEVQYRHFSPLPKQENERHV